MRDQTDFANTSSTTTAASTTICFLIAIIIIVIIVVVFIVLILQQQQQLLQLPPTPPLLLLQLQLLLLLPRLHKHKTIFINNNSDKNNNNNTNSIFWRKKHILREQTFKWNGCWTIFLKICLFFWPTNIIWWKLVVLQHAQTTHLCCSVVWDIGHLHEESRKGDFLFTLLVPYEIDQNRMPVRTRCFGRGGCWTLSIRSNHCLPWGLWCFLSCWGCTRQFRLYRESGVYLWCTFIAWWLSGLLTRVFHTASRSLQTKCCSKAAFALKNIENMEVISFQHVGFKFLSSCGRCSNLTGNPFTVSAHLPGSTF